MRNLFETLLNFFRHGGVRLYGSNIVYLFSERAIAFIFGFAVGVYVARELGADAYGLLTYAVSLSSIFGVIMTFGLESVMVRELVSRPAERDEILGTGAWLKAGGFLLMQLILALYIVITRPPLRTGLLIMIISSGYLFQILQVLEFYFQAEVCSKYISLSKLFSLTIYCSLRFVLILCGADLIWFAVVEALNMLCISAGYLWFYIRGGHGVGSWCFSRIAAVRMLKSGWPFYLSSLAIMLYMRIDQVVIKSFLGNAEVGIYSIAVRLVELFYFIPVIGCASLLPALIRAKERSEELYQRRLSGLFGLMFYMGLGCVLLCWCGSYLIRPVYGAEYAGAAGLLRSYSWVLLFIFTSQPLAQWYIVEGMQRYALLFALGTALLNIGLNLLLIRFYGVYGAVSATLGSYLLILLFGLLLPGTNKVTYLRISAPWRIISFCRDGLHGILQ